MEKKHTKTIAIDFDGVIHAYSKGWQDGKIYDEPVHNSIVSINDLLRVGYSVFIFSTRSPRQISKWLKSKSNQLLYMNQSDFMDYYYPMTDFDEALIKAEYENHNTLQFKVEIIPFWKKFWNKPNVIGITRRKLPAHCYVDDRAIIFNGDWLNTLDTIQFFKTYQENKK